MGTQELKNRIYQELINSLGKEVVLLYKKQMKSLNITVSFQRLEWWAREHFSKKMYQSDKHRVVLFCIAFFNKTHMESITALKTLDSLDDFDTHPMLTIFSFYLRKTTELAKHTRHLRLTFLTLQSFW